MTFTNFLCIFLGGGLGSMLRFILAQYANKDFPYGTLAVNLIGAFLIGLFMAMYENKYIGDTYKLLFVIGFAGGFTTFSSFVFELQQMMAHQQISKMVLYFLISNVLGILLVYIGWQIGEKIRY